MRKRAIFLGALLAVLGAVVIAGCGGSSSSSSSEPSSSENESASATTSSEGGATGTEAEAGGSGEATISTAEVGGVGTVLVDSEGMTVYLFTPDKGTESTCYGGCESAWPPVPAEGKPSAGEGASSSALGTTERKDGSMQVTYNGHPVYTFSGDSAPGEANGQEDDGTWFVMDEAGDAVQGGAPSGGTTGESSTTESSTTTGSGGGGY
jgi:predicted lipoprotein with Yx(FWY)xxD motif